jgi:hypothetical protein
VNGQAKKLLLVLAACQLARLQQKHQARLAIQKQNPGTRLQMEPALNSVGFVQQKRGLAVAKAGKEPCQLLLFWLHRKQEGSLDFGIRGGHFGVFDQLRQTGAAIIAQVAMEE